MDDDGENTFRAGTLVEASGCRVPGRVVLLFPSYIKGEREILFKRNYSNNSSDEARLFLSFKSIVRICFPRFINQGTISIEQKYPCRTTNLLCNRTIALCLLRTIRFFANITIRVAIFHDPSCFSSDTAHPIHVIVYEEQFKRRGSDCPLLPPLHSSIGRDFKDFAEQSNGLRMGVFRPRRRVGPSAEAESRVGVATDANYPHQIPTIHLNSVACQKNRRLAPFRFAEGLARLTSRHISIDNFANFSKFPSNFSFASCDVCVKPERSTDDSIKPY